MYAMFQLYAQIDSYRTCCSVHMHIAVVCMLHVYKLLLISSDSCFLVDELSPHG